MIFIISMLLFYILIYCSLMKGTNQQWDYPNGWAPINHMIIEGLRKSNNPTFVTFHSTKNKRKK